jgi:hypothetical protein
MALFSIIEVEMIATAGSDGPGQVGGCFGGGNGWNQ